MDYFQLQDNISFAGKGHDFVTSFIEQNYSVGIVCDGVSSTYEPLYGAETVCGSLAASIKKQLMEGRDVDYAAAYKTAAKQLSEQALNCKLDALQSTFATTAITAVFSRNEVAFTYCGNGAIIEIRPEWFCLPEEIPSPWGVNHYLNPHSRYMNGENRLYKTVRANDDLDAISPDVIRLTNPDERRSYFIICSDGLYSTDEISSCWEEATGQYFIIESRRLVVFLKILRQHHLQQWKNRDRFMIEYRDSLNKESLVNDDLSYVMFVPEP